MRKLIHSDFELDLSNFKISDTDQNSWFNDVFFTKYTFPFEIDLVKDLDIAFGFISLYNTTPKTFFNCKYVHNDEIQDATFEVTELGEKLYCTLEFGFEQLPSFDKKLSELSLQTFDLPANTDIYEHANSVITQSYPAVNYNFPAVHIDKIDNTNDDEWELFEKTINNRKLGHFVQNIYNTTEERSENYNIMQPLPYWLHILERGFADAGYTLAGEILQDERIKKATLYGAVDYFNELKQFQYYSDIYHNDCVKIFSQLGYDLINDIYFDLYSYTYNKTINIEKPGEYSIFASTSIFTYHASVYLKIKINGIDLYAQDLIHSIDLILNITILHPNSIVEIEMIFEDIDTNFLVTEFNVISRYYIDTNNNPLASIQNENKIQLKKSVPDITFNDFIKVIKNWFNYDIHVVDKVVYMNRIESNINPNNAIDMQQFEVKTPRRKFHQGNSFLLKFQDIDNKDYVYQQVFQDINQVINTGFITNEKTNTIEIQALPLPHLQRNSLLSAYAFEDNDSKVYLVPYNGLVNNKNESQPNTNYLLPEVHLLYWYNWFKYRINSIGFFWNFNSWEVNILNLNSKTKIYAYNNTHIIKTIQRTEIAPEFYNIDIETETIN